MSLYNYVSFRRSFILLLLPLSVIKTSVDRAFESLSSGNLKGAYFHFQKSTASYPVIGYYGLSLLHYGSDSPFYNIDSAWIQVNRSVIAFRSVLPKELKVMEKYLVTEQVLLDHRNQIARTAFNDAADSATVESYNHYISFYLGTEQLSMAVLNRDSIGFMQAAKTHTVQGYLNYMNLYPDSRFFNVAKSAYEKLVYSEITALKTVASYETYIRLYPGTSYTDKAWHELYVMNTGNGDDYHLIDKFISRYPSSPLVDDAWLRLYDLFIGRHGIESVDLFLTKFPGFPYKELALSDFKAASFKLFPVLRNGKWGYVDSTGVLKTKATYDYAGLFRYNRAVVVENGKFGFIDKFGQDVVPLFFDFAEDFSGGFSVVSKDGFKGVIDSRGKSIIPFEFDKIGDFDCGLIPVYKNGICGYMSKNGILKTPLEFDECYDCIGGAFIVRSDSLYGLYTENGISAVPIKYDLIESVSAQRFKIKKDGKFGLFTNSGGGLTGFVFDEVGRFSGGLAAASRGRNFGYIDTAGITRIPFIFSVDSGFPSGAEFVNGNASVSLSGVRAIAGVRGDFMLTEKIDDIRILNAGFAQVRKGNKWALYNFKNENNVSDFNFDEIGPCDSLSCVVRSDLVWGVIDFKGKITVKPKYDSLLPVYKNLFLYSLNGKIGLTDNAGNEIIEGVYRSWELYLERYLVLKNEERMVWFDLESRILLYNDSINQ